MSLEDYIDLIAEGKRKLNTGHLVSEKMFGIGYARGAVRSGLLSFYFRGKFYTQKRVNSRFEREKQMAKILSYVGKLQGEKYFLWQPDK